MSDVKELNIDNTTYDIKAKSVVDINNGKLKFWSGTRAQYDAIATKDANTLYNITDDNTADAYEAYTKSEVDTLLNGKASIDLANVTDTAKIAMAGASMPSNRYIDLTLGASRTTYTAPANGWFTIYKEAGNPGFRPYLWLVNTSAGDLSFETRPGENGSIALRLSIPAKKGDVIRIDYDAIGITRTFRFIYAEGSESEAQ